MPMRRTTSASLVNNFAPYCRATPSMAPSTNPRTNPSCRISCEKSFGEKKIICCQKPFDLSEIKCSTCNTLAALDVALS